MRKQTNKKKQQQRLYWFVLAFIAYACAMMLWVGGLDEAVPQTTLVYAQSIKQATNNAVEAKSSLLNGIEKPSVVRVTGFSSVECKTTWCRAHAGEPRGLRAAVNSKYGKVKRVYIPVFDKFYDVIGTTDYKTDVDIWFGDNQ